MTEGPAEPDDLLPYERVGYCYVTRGRTVTETDVVMHAGQTGDLYPIHLDAEAAGKSPYGQRIAHGTLTFSIATGLKFDMHLRERISYGYDRVRFIGAVFLGDTLRVRVTVSQSEPDTRRPGFWRVVESMEVINQRDEIVMVADHILMRWTQLEGEGGPREKPTGQS
jgi:monoamine oxidase